MKQIVILLLSYTVSCMAMELDESNVVPGSGKNYSARSLEELAEEMIKLKKNDLELACIRTYLKLDKARTESKQWTTHELLRYYKFDNYDFNYDAFKEKFIGNARSDH